MSDIAQSLRALAEKTTKNETPRSGDSSERGMSDIAQGLRALASERGMSDIAQGLRALAEKTASQTVLSLTEAKLAKKLGYELCLCTFPPSVMLWRETEKASVCPSCGRQSKTKQSKRK